MLRLIGDCAVAGGNRVAGIENNLAFELRRVIAANLRYRAVRYGQQHNVAEGNRLVDGPRLCQRSEACHEILQFFRVTRGQQYLVSVLDPETADRAADVAGTNGSDRQLAARGLSA